jgi:hypothetical protein
MNQMTGRLQTGSMNRAGIGSRGLAAGACALVLLVTAGEALGQNRRQNQQQQRTQQPTSTAPNSQNQPAQPAPKKGELLEGPFMVREMPKEWIIRSRIRVTSNPPGSGAAILALPPGQTRDDNAVNLGNRKGFSFQTMTVVFPIAPTTAGAVPHEDSEVEGWLKVDDKEVAKRPTLERARSQAANSRLARFSTQTGSGSNEVANGEAREIEMQIEVPMTCYRTRFDERAALEVPWPKSDWPAPLKSLFQPQVYVETWYDGQPFDQELIKNAVKRWAGEDPKQLMPVELAKTIAAGVVQDLQPSGDGRSVLRTGELQGFLLDGVQKTLEEGRGTEFDLACVLTAAYRSAGLPARLVLGIEAEDVDRKFLEKKGGKGKLRAWTEFALYDEANSTLNWVPVDIAKIRKQSSRPQPIKNTWKFFGTHDELNLIAPIALNFHPQASVVSYSVPGLWGWQVTPTPPTEAYQSLYFDAYRGAVRPTNNNKNDRNDRNRR